MLHKKQLAYDDSKVWMVPACTKNNRVTHLSGH
jgi:hypothetical protein